MMTSAAPLRGCGAADRRRRPRTPCDCTAGHRVGRREHGCPPLLFCAQFGLMLQVDVATPTEQDQRDVERQRRARDAELPVQAAANAQMVEERAAVPDQQHYGRDQDREHQRIAARICSRERCRRFTDLPLDTHF